MHALIILELKYNLTQSFPPIHSVITYNFLKSFWNKNVIDSANKFFFVVLFFPFQLCTYFTYRVIRTILFICINACISGEDPDVFSFFFLQKSVRDVPTLNILIKVTHIVRTKSRKVAIVTIPRRHVCNALRR